MSKLKALSRSFCLGLAALVGALAAAGAGRAAELEKQLYKEAPRILEALRKKGYHNVGVLKFRVKKGNKPLTANAGPLNLKLAQRLELALILVNPVKEPLGILHDASAVAARLPGASHLTAEGREKLFAADYPLAWGNRKVRPDAFLTGIAILSPDLRQMKLGILVFDKSSKKLEKVAELSVPTESDTLIESGESFLMRGLRGRPAEPTTRAAVRAALKVRGEEQSYPLADTDAPVELEIRYDDDKVDLKIENGQASIPEPQEGHTVKLILRRKGDSQERYGVVVKVNGRSTNRKEQLPDVDCRKWVLDPGDEPTVLSGFQIDDETIEKFRVLAPEESKARVMDYGSDVGTITITVFREKKGGDNAKPATASTAAEDDDAEDLGALTRGAFPTRTPANLAALLAQLRANPSRGLVEAGEKSKSDVQLVQFVADPVPVMSATIHYYKLPGE